MGRQGRWSEALDVTATLMQHQPAEYYWVTLWQRYWRRLMTGPLTSDSAKEFRPPSSRQQILTLPGGSRLVASSCRIPAPTRVLVDQLATKAVTLGKADSGIGYFKACKALSEYREGGFAQAVEWAERGRTNSEAFASAEAWCRSDHGAIAAWTEGRGERHTNPGEQTGSGNAFRSDPGLRR